MECLCLEDVWTKIVNTLFFFFWCVTIATWKPPAFAKSVMNHWNRSRDWKFISPTALLSREEPADKLYDDFRWHRSVTEYNNRAAVSPHVFCTVYNPLRLCHFLSCQLPLCNCVLFFLFYCILFNLITLKYLYNVMKYILKRCCVLLLYYLLMCNVALSYSVLPLECQ